MWITITPVIGDWYQESDGSLFEIVAMDESASTIEIQYFNGEIAEIDFSQWNEMALVAAPPPEDFTGAYEISKEDLPYEEKKPHSWSDVVSKIDPDKKS